MMDQNFLILFKIYEVFDYYYQFEAQLSQ
jgi:hypothetical protein